MGLFSSLASIFGAKAKRDASVNAAGAQVNAAQAGIDKIGDTTNQGVDVLAGQNADNSSAIQQALAQLLPFITQGQAASGAQGDILGLGGETAQAASIKSLQDSPMFKAIFGAGTDAILQGASATGGLRGGNVQTSLANFGGNALAQVIQQQVANLGGVSGQGLSAAGTSANTTVGGAQVGNQGANAIADALAKSGIDIASLLGDQGAAKAGGIIGRANGQADIYSAGAKGIGSALAGTPFAAFI